MLKTKSLLADALFISGIALVACEAAAQIATPPANVSPPPRTCTLPAGPGSSVVIEAGPDTSAGSGLAAIFPITEACPAPFLGMCRKWQYRWRYTGVNPSHSFVSFDTRATVFAAAPTAAVSAFLAGDSQSKAGLHTAGERFLRFNANNTTFLASFWTPDSVPPDLVTAGFQSGSRIGFCAILGAGSPVGDPGLSTALQLKTSTLGCTVEWTLTTDGCVLSAEVTQGACQIELTNIGDTITAKCGTEINVPGSCRVCQWSSTLKQYTCVTQTNDALCPAHTHQ